MKTILRLRINIKQSWIGLILFCYLPLLHAYSLDEILALKDPPEGVVIEILEGDEHDLIDIIPNLKYVTEEIRKQFPDLSIAVVSHGREQFALTRQNQEKHAQTHKGIKQLVANDVDIHVCGTHASWFDIAPEDYPEYIDVSPAAPAQINDYLSVGYIKLELF